MTHKDDLQILLMGNSHILSNLIPDTIGPGAFNAAISARPVYYDVQLMKQYVPRMKRLAAVIVPIDYERFYFGRDSIESKPKPIFDKRENTAKCMYYKYMDVKDFFWYWPELLNSNLNYMSRFWMSNEESRECDISGYQMLNLKDKKGRWEMSSVPIPIDSTKVIDKDAYNQLYNNYAEMAHITKIKQVRFILLGTPMYKTFCEGMSNVVVKDREIFVQKLKAEYPNVEYYDFSCDSRFEPYDFFNTDHLTERGAAKFSKMIKEIIDNPAHFKY